MFCLSILSLGLMFVLRHVSVKWQRRNHWMHVMCFLFSGQLFIRSLFYLVLLQWDGLIPKASKPTHTSHYTEMGNAVVPLQIIAEHQVSIKVVTSSLTSQVWSNPVLILDLLPPERTLYQLSHQGQYRLTEAIWLVLSSWIGHHVFYCLLSYRDISSILVFLTWHTEHST